MSILALRLHKDSVETSMGAVATLQQVANESGETMTRGQRIEVTIPANRGTSTHRVSVEAGRWLVEATLPSGEVITEEVAVGSGEDLPVTLHSVEHSPHEWLGLQYLVGNVEGADTLRRSRSTKRATLRTSAAGATRGGPGVSTQPPNVQTWQNHRALRGSEAWANILSPDTAFTSHLPIQENSSEGIWLYQLTDAAQQRRFGQVDWLGESFAVSLPLPWRRVRDHEPAPVQVMVHKDPRQAHIRIGVIVEDPDFAPLVGLMTASTLPKAVVAVNQARDLLFGKMDHPLAAAAGGYILLAAGGRERNESWHDWIDNLANLFPEIPDGAILKASLRLRFPKSESSAEEARASLLEAFDRGIPYYSAGVSWLLDGMTQFADDPAVAEKMKLVHRVALRLDVTQAFTVVRISERIKR